MAADADELGAVPGEEVSGRLTYACWVGEFAKADRAALALISERPAEAEEADGERCDGWTYSVVSRPMDGLRCERSSEMR